MIIISNPLYLCSFWVLNFLIFEKILNSSIIRVFYAVSLYFKFCFMYLTSINICYIFFISVHFTGYLLLFCLTFDLEFSFVWYVFSAILSYLLHYKSHPCYNLFRHKCTLQDLLLLLFLIHSIFSHLMSLCWINCRLIDVHLFVSSCLLCGCIFFLRPLLPQNICFCLDKWYLSLGGLNFWSQSLFFHSLKVVFHCFLISVLWVIWC